MLNKLIMMGRFTRDPEISNAESGTKVANFSIACDRDFKDKNGERATDFINCVAFNHTAEFIEEYFHKGSMAVVDGRLQIDKFTGKDGTNKIATKLVVNNIYFGGAKSDSENSGKTENSAPAAKADDNEPAASDEDLPF